ncbi:MAG TPA: amino acid ABC transporter substrate-binding protein [Casimicrobiaceae bacterium]|nr:amino acid ABC transporter substrate-binding protein [Casimicrobiaceae bacterium]
MHTIRRNMLAAALGAALLGVAMPGIAATDDTITLGAAVSLTGKYSTNGKNTKDGYDLAVKAINDKGGIKVGGKAYKLKVVYYDDESTSARGAQLVERLIAQDHVDFVLGPYSSALTKSIAPVTEKYRMPMVEGNGADRDLFKQGYKYLFAVLNTSDYYLREAVNILAEQAKAAGRDPKTIKIAIAIENDNFSQDVRDGIVEDAKKYGMQVVVDDKLPADLNDMTATLTKVKALKPDALMISGHEKGAVLGIRQVAEQKVYVPMLALTHCDSAQITQKFGKESDYALCGSQWDVSMTYSDPWFGNSQKYAEMFKKAYNYDPPYQAAESTASVEVFADAIGRAGSLDKDKVRDALAKTDLMTFYGPVKFDASGKNVAKSMVMYQVQHEKYVVVAPSKWAEGKPIYPAPTWDKRETDSKVSRK